MAESTVAAWLCVVVFMELQQPGSWRGVDGATGSKYYATDPDGGFGS